MLGYRNAEIVENISQTYHFKVFPRFFLCGCNVFFIAPRHQNIIYMHHNIKNYFSNFIENQSCIIKIIAIEIHFHKKLSQFLVLGSQWLFEAIHGFDMLTYFMLLPLHNKSFSLGHKKLLFHISIEENIFYVPLMDFPRVFSFQGKECRDGNPFRWWGKFIIRINLFLPWKCFSHEPIFMLVKWLIFFILVLEYRFGS